MEYRPHIPPKFRTSAATYLSKFSAKQRGQLSSHEVNLLQEAGRSSISNSVRYFVIGGTIGLLLGMGIFKNLKSKSEIRRLRKQLDEAGQEVSQLRTMSLKDL